MEPPADAEAGVRRGKSKHDTYRKYVVYRKALRPGPISEFTLWVSRNELEEILDAGDRLLDSEERAAADEANERCNP